MRHHYAMTTTARFGVLSQLGQWKSGETGEWRYGWMVLWASPLRPGLSGFRVSAPRLRVPDVPTCPTTGIGLATPGVEVSPRHVNHP